MVIALQDTAISWDLTSPVTYQAEKVLACAISFTAPEAGKYYLLGALYTTSLEYISGTLFGVLLPEGSDYAVNSTQYTSLWEMGKGEEKQLPCEFTFNRSDLVLGLFLLKMAGEEPSLDADEQIGSLSVRLSSPVPPITVESLMSLVMVVGVCGFMMHETLKD